MMVLALYNTAEAWTVYGDGRQSCASWTKAQEHRPVATFALIEELKQRH
jgi:hypothetical protein